MLKIAPLAAIALSAALMLWSAPGRAAPSGQNTDTFAQATKRTAQAPVRRPRPQVRISPRYPYRTFQAFYPLPYDVEYPGPNGVRQCVNRYVTEHRPSGNVIVPRMTCRWVVRR